MQQVLRSLALLGAMALGLCWALASAQALTPTASRFALVIGNGAYHTGPLPTPSQDAKAVAQALRSLGFKVIELIDASKADMNAALLQAGEAMNGGLTIGVLYYSGHALQFGQRNYLVPVDARLSGPGDVLAHTLDVQGVLQVFERAGNRSNVFVFDACRESPFGASASARGLAQMEAPPGTLVAFAAAPGEVANDTSPVGGLGLYTHHLLAELGLSGGKIEDLFKRVRYQVRKHSHGQQLPWESTSLEDDFYFDLPRVLADEAPSAGRPPQVGDAGQPVRAAPFRSEFLAGKTQFIGSFKADTKANSYSGTGKVVWADGDSFEGTLVSGKREGHGKFAWADGQRYEGQWRDDQPNGQGMLWFANGDVYEGTLVDGQPRGQGRMRFATGDRYVGELQQGVAHGRGAYTWTNGQTLVGRWIDGRVEGIATMRFVNGDVYEGEVVQGHAEGQGRMAFRSGDVYTGRFKRGLPDGEGTYTWPNGDRFVGRWNVGQREGAGVMTLRNGDRWEGRYSADRQAEGQWIVVAK
jgi:hypothetical protein